MSEVRQAVADEPEDDLGSLSRERLGAAFESYSAFGRNKSGRERAFEQALSTSFSHYLRSLDRLSKADPKDVQEIAASQIELLTSFYTLALSQAGRSFKWALGAGIAGVVVILLSLAVLFTRPLGELAAVSSIIAAVGGVIVEVISGLLFYLYGKTSTQLADFHIRLDRTQRYLLANSMCEGLDGDYKQQSRQELVRTIAIGDGLIQQPEGTKS